MEVPIPSSPSIKDELVVCPSCDVGYEVPLQILQRDQVKLRCTHCKEIFSPPLEFQNIRATTPAENAKVDDLDVNLGGHPNVSTGNADWENSTNATLSTTSSHADAFGAAGLPNPDFPDVGDTDLRDVGAVGPLDAEMDLGDDAGVSLAGDVDGLEVDLGDDAGVSLDGGVGEMEVDFGDDEMLEPVPNITDMVDEVEEEVENLASHQENKMGVEEMVMGLDEEAEVRLTEPVISPDTPPFALGEEVPMPNDSQTTPSKEVTTPFWRRLFSRNKKASPTIPTKAVSPAKPSLWRRLFGKKAAAMANVDVTAAMGVAGMAAEWAQPSPAQTSSVADMPDSLNDLLGFGGVHEKDAAGLEDAMPLGASLDSGSDGAVLASDAMSSGDGELSVDLSDDEGGISLSDGDGELSVDLGDDEGGISSSGGDGELSVDLGDDEGGISLSDGDGELSVDLGDDEGGISSSGGDGELSVDLGDDETGGSEEQAYMAATDIGAEAISGEHIPDEERFDLFLKHGEALSAAEELPKPAKANMRKHGPWLKKAGKWAGGLVCAASLLGGIGWGSWWVYANRQYFKTTLGNFEKKVLPVHRLVLAGGLRGRYVNNANGVRLFVVQGTLKNRFSAQTPLRWVRLKGLAYANATRTRPLAVSYGYAGQLLSNKQLRGWSVKRMVRFYNRQKLLSKETAGKNIPFQLIFLSAKTPIHAAVAQISSYRLKGKKTIRTLSPKKNKIKSK